MEGGRDPPKAPISCLVTYELFETLMYCDPPKPANPWTRIYKFTDPCLNLLQVCLFRSGLVGAVMKLPCCDGATCTLLGSKFVCVDDK